MQEALEILRQPTFAWKEGQFDNTLPSINLEKYCKTLENLKEFRFYLSLPCNFKASNTFIHAWKAYWVDPLLQKLCEKLSEVKVIIL